MGNPYNKTILRSSSPARHVVSPMAAQRMPAHSWHVRHHLARCPEIDCLRPFLPPASLAAAELRAIETGTSADRVLVTQNVMTDEQYARILAASLGARFEPLTQVPRTTYPAQNNKLIEGARRGMLWLNAGDRPDLVVAPQHLGTRALVDALQRNPALAGRIKLTTSQNLVTAASHHADDELSFRAVQDLKRAWPALSTTGMRLRLSLLPVVALLICLAGWIAAPALVNGIAVSALALIFLGWIGLRIMAAFTVILPPTKQTAIPDRELPVYSIIVALYREAKSVVGLVQSLRGLDYPAEKLDIIFVLEPDDRETWTAIRNLDLGPPFTLLTATKAGPKTKPKALNAALAFARGAYLAVFDAEDRPEPDQLRAAAQAFRAADDRLACVQARLTIDNSADNWLTRMFAAEYAGLFDVFLPGIAVWHLPLPLGGSSNHFRTSTLRKVRAWDPYNVTEDADLGMRFARLGYRTAVIDSSTYEEAPARFSSWLRQRTRWFKGWMQTWLVHMRDPLKLWRELGTGGFLTFQLVIGGTVLAALVHGIFLMLLFWQMANLWQDTSAPGLIGTLKTSLYVTTFLGGYTASILLALIGLARRRMLSCAFALFGMPIYWLLLSLAAWRALIHLVADPYGWEKTEHGLARTSRRSSRKPQSF